MTIEFCPLEAAWGNWADWAAVVAGVLAAVGTIVVAVLANRTSKRAAEIAEEAKGIAAQQHNESVKLREANARIIGRLLLHEVSEMPARLDSRVRALESAVGMGADPTLSVQKLLSAVEQIQVPLLPNAERVEDRIHTLPNSIGADLATMISHTRDLVGSANRVRDRIQIEEPRAIGMRTTFHFLGHDELGTMRKQLAFVAEVAPEFAMEFRAFVLAEAEK